jgi:gliding motility-associated-like protein
MKKTTLQFWVTISFFLFFYLSFYAQNRVPFTVRYDKDLKGEMLLIGNNILNRDNGTGQRPNNPYNATGNTSSYNSDFTMNYIDVDSDASTFSSSSGDLTIPNPACFKIVYAGLYWGALLQSGSRTDINKVKLKLPTGGYNNIVGQVIYDADPAPIGGNKPYSCYADVTALLTGLANPQGTYTVANVLSSQGSNGGTGLCAGWSLFIVYEDPTLPSKSITSFDGFSGITSTTGTLDIPVSGFRTIPAGPVRAEFAFSALEGDNKITGDYFKINGTTISTPQRPAANFFNSSITDLGGTYTARNPSSINTLGFDTGVLTVPNPACAGKPGGCVINNGDTAATITLGTTQDTYFYYFNAFAVDIIQPDIVLTKVVQDVNGNDASGANVTLGQTLFYEIGYQNVGNDDAINFTIKDVLPLNTIFDPANLDFSGSGGASLVSYTAATRTLIFSIPNSAVKVNSNLLKIRFKVKVVPNCNDLSDACSNIIKNQAFATYTGFFSGTVISNDPSISSISTCNLASPSPTNFLVGVTGCSYTKSEVLCGTSVVLTASNGYTSYSWSTSPTGIPVIGTTQSITVTNVGTYYVHDTAAAPCLSIDEVVTVKLFGNTVSNPIIPYADKTVTCPNDGKLLPLIFLCGANATKNIQSNVSDGSTIVWEKLIETSCPVVINVNCANENGSCTWSQVATGPDYIANTSGQFRMVLNYPGGCFSRFYFNVYQNLLNPTASVTDIFCNTAGSITVGGVPPGYEYSLNGGAYQSNNVFSITAQGSYTVNIRQTINATNPCVFTIPNIQVNKKDLAIDITLAQPLCNGSKGSIQVAANFVRPQYFYKLSQGASVINSVGPILENNYAFNNLNSGVYTVEVSTSDGCLVTQNVTLIDPPKLSVTAALTLPLTCLDGEITIYPVGGTAVPGTPSYYYYFINSTTDFQVTPIYPVTAAGVYNIQVIDFNNCKASTSITVDKVLAPTYNISKTDELCAGTNSGTITVNTIVPNGNALRYSIDNGVTFFNSPVFNALAPGNYNVVVEYVTSGSVCVTPAQAITINAATPISFGTSITADYTCTTLGEITITPWPPTGGTAPYSTSIDGVTFTLNKTVYSGLTNGTYNISVKDANSCITVSSPIVFVPMSPPIINSIATTALKCPGNMVDVTVNVTGGVFTAAQPVLRYQYSNDGTIWSAYQVSNVLNNIAPGTYFFRATDGKNCFDTKTFTITALPPITVVGQLINNVRCKGNTDGAIRFTVSGLGNNVNYSYTINGVLPAVTGTTPATGLTTFVVNLPEPVGTYVMVVTDTGTTCTGTATVVVAEPASPLDFTFVATPIKCLGVNGTLVITATGGWGGFSYVLTPPSGVTGASQISNTFSNLTVGGNYVITTTDVNGCSVSKNFTLTAPVNPTASIDPTSDLCYDGGNAATITVSATGDVGRTLEFNINGGAFQLSNTFANLTPGSYTIIVRDDFGCSVTLPVVTIASQLTLSTILTKDLDCNIPPDAIIDGAIGGGTAPFTISVITATGAGTLTPPVGLGTTFSYTATKDGDYQFQVTDATGVCSALSGVTTIMQIVSPSVIAATTPLTCSGSANGTITVTASLGIAPYTYSIDNGVTFQSSNVFTGLAAGGYQLVVKDNRGCKSVMTTVTIIAPNAISGIAEISVPYTCLGTGTVSIQAPGVSGGTGPYTYSINGVTFQAGSSFAGLTNGTYSITIKDANNCTFVTNAVTIAPLVPPTNLDFSPSAITCPSNTSDVALTVTGGFGTLSYQIIAPVVGIAQPSNVFTALAPGTYTFQVTDANSCTYQESYTVVPLPVLSVTGQIVNNVKCKGSATGSVQFTVSGSSGFAYTINGVLPAIAGVSPVVLNNLATGNYTIDVTDTATGCIKSGTITVAEPAVALSVTLTPKITCTPGNSGSVVVTAIDGWGGYAYTLTPITPAGPVVGPQNSNTFVGLTVGDYSITTIDANGCSIVTPFTLSPPVGPTVTIDVTSDLCYDTTNQSTIVITAAGGVAPYVYSIDNGTTYQASNTFNNLTPTTYTVIVKDAYECISTALAQIIAPQLVLNMVLTKDLDCTGSPAAIITGTIIGGTAPYVVTEIIGGSGGVLAMTSGTTFTYTTSNPRNYQFQVVDANVCNAVSGVTTVNPIENPVITSATQIQPILCHGESTAVINVVIDSNFGTAPFVINVLNTTTGTDYGTQTIGLAAGVYTITVTDAKSCSVAAAPITISEPALLDYNSTVTPIQCAGGVSSLGQICVQGLIGGTAPFTYTLTPLTVGGTVSLPHSDPTGANYCFSNLDFGIYELSVQDANGCTVVKILDVSSPPNDLVFVNPVGGTCATGWTVEVTVAPPVPGGPYEFGIVTQTTPPYAAVFQLADDPVLFPLVSTFTGLPSGAIITFVVRDQTSGCRYFETTTIPTGSTSTLTGVINSVNNVTCTGNADGNVSFTIDNYATTTTSVDYVINNAFTNISTGVLGNILIPVFGTVAPIPVSNIGPLPPGTYNIMFTEQGGAFGGCGMTSANFTITQSAVILSVSAAVTKNDNCNNTGQISAVAQGGTAPYQYELVGPVNIGYSNFSTFPNTSSVLLPTTGNYTVNVKDANGCVKSTPVIILPLDPTPVVSAVLNNQCTANEGAFSITVTLTTSSITPYSYSIDGGVFQNQTAPFTISNLASGTHTVEINDFNGCGNLVSVVIAPPLGLSASFTTQPICTNADGVITAVGIGGTGNYSYTLLDSASAVLVPAQPSGVFSTIAAGSYQVLLTDTTTLCTITIPVIIAIPIDPDFISTDIAVNNVSCTGANDANITVNLRALTNADPLYTYTLTPTAPAGPSTGPQSSTVFSNLAPGTYDVTVTSGRGCSTTVSQIVTEPVILKISSALSPFTCTTNVANATQVTITGTDGTAPYTFSSEGINYFPSNTLPLPDANYVFSVSDTGTVQNITYHVKDANGCEVNTLVSINPFPKLTSPLVTQNLAITCTNTEDVTLSVTGSVGPFTYQVLPAGAPNVVQDGVTPSIFHISAPGTYFFQINDTGTGCSIATLPYTVMPFNLIDVTATATSVTCFGDADGAITVNISGYTGTFDYEVFDSLGVSVSGLVTGKATPTPLVIPNFTADNYTIRITETATPFCIKTSNVVTVGSPVTGVAIALVSNKNANCNSLAEVIVNGSGGTPGYTYAFKQDGVAPALIDYLPANTALLNPVTNTLWDVWVKDANDCPIKLDVTIATDPAPVIALSVVDNCALEGSFAIEVTETTVGIAPYTISINGGVFQNFSFVAGLPNTYTISNLNSGDYTIVVKDFNGCFSTQTITITSPLSLSASFTTTPICNNSNGAITATATGGSANYTFAIVPNSAPITEAGGVFSNVPPGNYTITVTDVTTTCTQSVPVSMPPATAVTFTTSVTNVSCNGGINGTITVNLGPGINDNPLYTYQLNGGLPQNSNLFTGLAAGTYTIQVNSGKGCFAIDNNVVITEPLVALSVSGVATVFGCAPDNSVKTATITVTALDGTGPYTFSIDNLAYFTSNIFDVIDTGTIQNITVYAKDANGCFVVGNTIIINPLPKITASSANVSAPIDCNGIGTLTVVVTGGSGNFSYQLLPNGLAQPSAVFAVTSPGNYYFQVNDLTTGCTFVAAPYTVLPFNTINVVATPTTAVTCFGDTNGAVEINVTGYPGGAYSYDVLDTFGAIVLSGVGNAGTNPQLISGLAGGNYTVRVIETASPFCTFITNVFTIASPFAPLSVLAAKTSDVTCTNDKGTIATSGTGGWGALEYELTGSVNAPYSPNGTFGNLPAGTYTINVKDSKGCISSSLPVVLDVPLIITIPPITNPPTLSCYGDTNAVITVGLPTGGQGSNYSYSLVTLSANPPTVSGPQASNVFSGLGAGSYAVTVTDGWGCTQTSPQIIIDEPSVVTASLMLASRQTCTILPVLTLTPAGGTLPYSYSIDGFTYAGSIVGATNITVPIPLATPATYHYFIKDNNGCVSSISNDITIDPLEILTANLNLANAEIFCRGDATGVLVATALGGLGSYVYTLLDGAGTAIAPAPTQIPPGNFTGLAAGSYQVHLDSNDCSFTSRTIEIKEPLLNLAETHLITNVSCNGNNDGQIVINATGGTGIIKYAITPDLDQFLVDNTFKNLSAGSYKAVVQDENGCYIQIDFVITQPSPISAVTDPASIVQELCFGDKNAAFNVVVTGGTEPYSTSLDDINGVYTTWPVGQSPIPFAGLTGGNHTVYIRDFNGCEYELSVPLNPAVLLDPKAIVDYACAGNLAGNRVTVTIDASNIPADVVYSLDNSSTTQISNVFTNLTAGDHFIMVHHKNGCVDATPVFNILQVEPLVVTLSQGPGLNEIVAAATGGSGIYQYALNGESYGTQNKFIYYHTGDYTVVVTDSYGCTATDTKFFEFIDIEIPNIFTPNGNGTNDTWKPEKTDNYPDMILRVYDRYGREISTLSQGESWDGKYNGKELPMGDYWYLLKLKNTKDDREFIGHFTLYR